MKSFCVFLYFIFTRTVLIDGPIDANVVILFAVAIADSAFVAVESVFLFAQNTQTALFAVIDILRWIVAPQIAHLAVVRSELDCAFDASVRRRLQLTANEANNLSHSQIINSLNLTFIIGAIQTFIMAIFANEQVLAARRLNRTVSFIVFAASIFHLILVFVNVGQESF